jgi:hypothetical protein
MKRVVVLFAIACACRRDPEPTVTVTKAAPPPPVASSAAPITTEISYADLCARSTPATPTTAAVNALYAEIGERLDLRAKTVLGAIRADGVDPRKRHELLRAGAIEQGLKACPLANIWEASAAK